MNTRVQLAMVLGAMTGLAACGGQPLDGEEDVTAAKAQLLSSDWVNQWSPQNQEPDGYVSSETPPVVCETRYEEAGGVTLFKTDATNHIQISWKSYSPWTSWLTIGTGVQFTQKPACAGLDGTYSNKNAQRTKQVAILGKGASTGRYWIAIWKLGSVRAFGETPSVGSLVRDWQTTGSDAFDGAPAATVQAGKLLVVGRKSNNSLVVKSYTINTMAPNDPISGGTWTSTTMPALPTGWIAFLDPAITHAPAAYGPAMIVVAASSTTGVRLYRSTTSNGTTFSNWSQISTTAIVAGSFGPPAIEIGFNRDATFRYTVYLLSPGDGIVYSASTNPGTTTFESFKPIPSGGAAFVGGIAAAGGNLGGDPTHLVFAKPWGNDTLQMTATVPGLP